MERRHESVSITISQRCQIKDLTAAESEMITFDVRPFHFTEAYAGFSCLIVRLIEDGLLIVELSTGVGRIFVERTTSNDVG